MGTNFWKLLAASATSNLADGIGRAALPLLAATLTRDPLAISGLYSLAFLPWLLCALPAGALVDRTDRRRAMVLANTVRGLLVAGLTVAVATGHATIPLLYVVAFALGIAETVYDSAANAFLPQVVRPDQLERGNSLLVTGEAVGQIFLGGPVGALLFTLAVALPFGANAAGFLACALVMVTVAGDFRPALASTSSIRADIVDGVRWLSRQPLLRGLTLLFGLTSACGSAANAVLVLYALDVLGLSPRGYGFLLLAGGVGGLLGGLVAPLTAARLGRLPTMVLGTVVSPALLAAMGFVRHPVAGAVLFGGSAASVMILNVLTMALRQALIPEELFGRVQGAWRTLVWGGIPVGGVAGGALAAATDVATVFAAAGIAGFVVGCAVVALLLRNRAQIAAAYLPKVAVDA
ncbi:MFS transporter [Virgisporangium aliadipatigenens]|uniref:MFS transporter n=1 Tax=Virgisporangium aliadipatigenens TaxID=741659 RepID=A0A8J3YQZ7_9ACTN|nr:MFS transporter [Virgisporangium aliadipatigenens]GIJ48738.1 MFS transporter [Virgisporangium aliadipatigenens]